MTEIAGNVHRVRERLAMAAGRAGRRPEEIKLVAVTKNVSLEAIRAALAAGITIVGENRVQEAQIKVAALGNEVEWHFIGHLQTNKVKQVVPWVTLLHSLDSMNLALELEKQGANTGKEWRTLVQVNISGESTKFGLPPAEVPFFLEKVAELSHIRVEGLMTIPPFSDNPEEARPVFRRLCQLAASLAGEGWPRVRMEHLSMGMSDDFEVAVEEGATMVRIGTAIFGRRRT